MGFSMITTSQLTGEECEVLHVANDTTLAQLALHQLAQLAVHHVNARWDILLWWRSINDQSFSAKEAAIGAYAEEQLEILESLMGPEAFEGAIREEEKRCQRSYAKLEAYERNLARCLLCNDERILTTISDLDERLCCTCGDSVLEAARARLPICDKCGEHPVARDSAGCSNRCALCVERSDPKKEPDQPAARCPDCASTDGHYWECPAALERSNRVKAPNQPAARCPDCAAELSGAGSFYTGNRCWDCAGKRLAPCRDCGGTRKLRYAAYESCGRCMVDVFTAASLTVQPGYSASLVVAWRSHLASEEGRLFREPARVRRAETPLS